MEVRSLGQGHIPVSSTLRIQMLLAHLKPMLWTPRRSFLFMNDKVKMKSVPINL